MPENVECESCGLRLLGIAIEEPEPIDHDSCPECDGTEFVIVDPD